MRLGVLKEFSQLDENRVFLFLIFCFPLFAFVIKGWVNFFGALLFIFSIYPISRNLGFYFRGRDAAFYGWVFALSSPFFISVIVQLIRLDEFDWAICDGPSKFLLATFIFVYLSRRDSLDFLRYLHIPIFFSLIVTVIVASFSFESNQFWNRWSTYFVDPNTLPTYAVSLFALCVPLRRWETLVERSFFLIVFAALVLFLFHCQSRSSWNGAVALVFCLAYLSYLNGQLKVFSAVGLLFFTLLIGLNLVYGTISIRYFDMFREIGGYFVSGDSSTSVGTRIALFVFAWDLILLNPLLGVPDGAIPSLADLGLVGIEVSTVVFEVMRQAGPHNELLANLLRYGVLGFLPIFGIFIIPLFLSFRYGFRVSFQNSGSDSARSLFMFIFVLLACAQTIEVLNLKMTSTIYATYLSLLLPAIYNQMSSRKLYLKAVSEKIDGD